MNAKTLNWKLRTKKVKVLLLQSRNSVLACHLFFVDFLMKLGCDTEEKAKKLQEVCMSCMGRNLDVMIKDILLDDNETSDDLENDIETLKSEMKSHGFSDKEIENIVDLVRDCGSIDAANDVLKKIGEQSGIDWSST